MTCDTLLNSKLCLNILWYTAKPTLEFLNPDADPACTLVVLHGNAQVPEDIAPFYSDLVNEGWRVAFVTFYSSQFKITFPL